MISFAANISLVEVTLQECLSQATCSDDNHHDDECVSSDRKDTTKAYLGATDSMRLLQWVVSVFVCVCVCVCVCVYLCVWMLVRACVWCVWQCSVNKKHRYLLCQVCTYEINLKDGYFQNQIREGETEYIKNGGRVRWQREVNYPSNHLFGKF